MLESPIPNNQVVTVMVAQTTFAVLTILGRRYRVDYLEKAEARLKPGVRGEFVICSEHPLLLGYNSRSATVYINSKPQEPEELFFRIREQIQAGFQGWRDWRCVLFGKGKGGENLLRKNLTDGSGMLLESAPVTIAKAVIATCAEHGVSTYIIGGLNEDAPAIPKYHLLLIGDGYVIAQDFRFTEVFHKNIPTSKSSTLIPINGTTTPPRP
ncbi:hypothetical protein MON38_18855 [Hymenobacter sp. DH14]|uniref:Uncharacterized protein n=1 Tax=Hymenobacter cyanobacteriorum TaxID=2926463 RepID=A0A9X2AH37_9BACT|nr:hypothetical protein [Hymenobacter cyanobacteriorum]MCI1189487.1 hypothetical protein [Hymenobacter cyanobacteriorum]